MVPPPGQVPPVREALPALRDLAARALQPDPLALVPRLFPEDPVARRRPQDRQPQRRPLRLARPGDLLDLAVLRLPEVRRVL
jgi:hypothetical protein